FVEGVADEIYEDAVGGATVSEGGSSSTRKGSFSDDGIFSFLWIAIVAGFAALLTPCVFPMIPLTVSYFSKQEDAKRGISSALIFGVAIVITFTVIGAA
ncbi:MAG TPA: hypothetical protein DCX27_05960, partial [Balneola sp.]|nr:hypothetical protein [Balneola sp.]